MVAKVGTVGRAASSAACCGVLAVGACESLGMRVGGTERQPVSPAK